MLAKSRLAVLRHFLVRNWAVVQLVWNAGTCGLERQVRPCLTCRITQRKTKIKDVIEIKCFQTNQNVFIKNFIDFIIFPFFSVFTACYVFCIKTPKTFRCNCSLYACQLSIASNMRNEAQWIAPYFNQ